LFVMVILSRPLCLLWQSYYLRNGENTSVLIGISVFLDLITLIACALLGTNRLRGILSAAFVYSIITVTQFPVVYFLALVVQPLLRAYPGISPGWTGMICRQTIMAQANCSNAR